MGRFLLTVQQYGPALPQKSHQTGQGCARGFGFGVEHGFAKKSPAQSHAVKAARQRAVPPGFNGVGIAQGVQALIGRNHLRDDPGSGRGGARCGAGSDDPSKSPVQGKGKRPAAQGPGAAPGQMKGLQRQHATWIWRPPEHGQALFIPGEDAPAVGRQQAFGPQVTPQAQETVRMGRLQGRELCGQRRHRAVTHQRTTPGAAQKPADGGTGNRTLMPLCTHFGRTLQARAPLEQITVENMYSQR